MDKHCYKCGEIKELNDFNNNAYRYDGKQSACRQCDKQRLTKNYKVKHVHIRLTKETPFEISKNGKKMYPRKDQL